MFQSRMGSQNGIVWLDNGSGDLRGRVNSKFKFSFLSIINRESFHQKRGKTGTSSTAERVENQETLESGTIVGEFSDSVKDIVNELFANSVVTSSIVVGGIFFTGNQLLWMKELFV